MRTNDNFFTNKSRQKPSMAWCVVYGGQYCSSSVILMDYYSVFSPLLLCLSPLLMCHLYLHRLLLLLPYVSGSFLGLLLDLSFFSVMVYVAAFTVEYPACFGYYYIC